MNRKTKIIIISVLLALAFGTLIFAAVARGVWDNNPNTETAAADSAGSITLLTNAANAENGMLTANGVSTDYVTLESSGNDTDIGISPMGWWEDLWKIPEEINVYGTVHAGDKNTTVSSGSYTNKAYGYTAPDGFPQFQYSTDGSSWNATVLGNHMMFSNTNTNGWKYYRGYKPDPKGDYTKVSSICLDTVKPQIQVRLNGSSVASGTVTTSGGAIISILGSDSLSGVNTYWYTMNGYGGTYYQCYSSSTFSSDGVYTFYCIDRAGNVSDTVTVTKDTTAPTVRAYNGSSQISNGAIVYASTVRFEASDSTTGVNYIYVRTPGTSYYSAYASTSVSFTAEGLYYYYASDKAGNYSSTYTVTVDRTAPTAYLYSGTTSVSNNYFSAASYIRFTASDTNGCTVYMKKDSGSYGVYTSGTNQTAEGVYSFYAVDPAGNSTSTYTITLDRTAPVGTLYAGTTVVSSGKITNASYVKYTATDNLALSTLYVRTPGASSYVSFTSGTQYTADGTYYFYATDKSGNASSTVSIVLDRTKPVATITAGTTTIASGGFTNSNSVKFSASDTTSGVSAMYVRLPNTSSYISYVANTPFSAEGIYYFYATDVAGNTGDTVNVTIDVTKPTGTLTANGYTVTSGSFTNKAFYYTATDTLSGIAKCELKRPGSSTWETYTSGTTIAATSTQGLYSFRSTDKAGNVSAESQINLVTNAPTVTIYAGTTVVSSDTFTNSAYVAFTAAGASGATVTLYVKIPGGSFALYAAGTQLSKEGKYEVYATDNSGNTSATVTVTLDNTKPTGTLTANGSTVTSGSFTNKAFYYTAIDSLSGISKCEIKRPGSSTWETYTSGTTIAATSTQGLYSFRSTDKAGNVSLESQINLVTNAPTVIIYAGTTIVSSGTFVNSSYVAFTAAGASSATVTLYVKIPGGSFALYAAGTQLSKEGNYEVYATDNSGNTSATVTVTLDITKPTGTLTANGSTVTSGSFTNKAFYYTATDSLSGIAKCELKRPGSSTWEVYTSGTSIAATSANGLYSFRSTDKAGNVSAESYINLVTAAPSITLYAGAATVSSGTYTNKSYVAFTVTAYSNATASLYVKIPGGSFALYAAGTQLSKEGKYEVYSTDNAGNTSSTLNLTLDTSIPVGTITVGGTVISSGDYVNTAFKYAATDSVSGISKLEILRPSGTWQTYSGDEITVGSGNGWYSFRATDNAGNVSVESKVYLLTSAPIVQLYVDEQPVANGTYTNSARISMSASGGAGLTCYVKTPGASGYAVYNQYYSYTAAGRYEFYAEDAAGNKSGMFAVIIDRTAKPVTISGVSNGIATGDVSATWSSGTDSTASIVSVKINGIAYTKGSAIKTINGGIYNIESTDAAGNVWTSTFTAQRTEILSDTLNKQFFETKDSTGNTYAFDSYEKALVFAAARENALVRTAVWNGAVWDGGIAIDSIDSANAKNGTYYIYKKSGDKSTEVAYFTLERLNAVIAEYAAESVNSFYWWQKTSAQSYTGNDLYSLKDSKVFIGDSVTLASHANYLIDGTPFAGLTYDGEGIHTLTIYDNYGNSYEYVLKISKQAPKLNYMVEGGGVFNTAAADRQYNFAKAVTVKITDGVDDYAMFYITNSAGETVAILSLDDEYVLNKSGRYTIQAVNHSGKSEEFVFILSLSAPTATFTDNGISKRLEMRIESSQDLTATLTDIKIYKSTDSGLTWVLLTADDYGRNITASRLFYEFNKDGIYKVIIEDNFRNGLDAVTVVKDYKKPAPVGTLNGVTDGSITNDSVKFVWTDEAFAYLTYNGETASYLSGTQITLEGDYILEFCDGNGYSRIYTFSIDKTKPVGTVTANGNTVHSESYINKAFKYSATDNYGVAQLEIKRQSGVWETYDGSQIAVNSGYGWYIFRAVDLAGNVSDEIRVYLITTAPTVTLYAGTSAVENGAYTNNSYVSFTATSAAGTVMYVKAPGESDYTVYSGAQLTAEGAYYFYAVDLAGNVSGTLTITLDKSKPVGSIATESTNGYTNKAFAYSATDGISGVARLEIKRPNGVWEIYNGGQIAANSGDGWYAFRAFDLAGNVSEESHIYLITAAPQTAIYAGLETLQSGMFTNKGNISFTATSEAGVIMYVKLPGESNYTVYSGAQLNVEGTYYFYATDIAGNVSNTVSVTLDTSIPMGIVTVSGAIIEDGGYINKAFIYSATDNISGIARLEIKRPGDIWETYGGEEIAVDSSDGWYAFRAIDNAGNVSAESLICLITLKPTVTIYAGAEAVQSGAYINDGAISFTSSQVLSGEVTMYVRLPGATEYVVYEVGTQFSGEGIYYVYSIDAAGNVSDTVSLTLDTSLPTGIVTVSGAIIEDGGYINKAFIYSATDDISGIARLEIKCPGGVWETYNGEEILASSGDGWYAFRAFDLTGNMSEEIRVYLITAAPSTVIYAGTEQAQSGSYTNKSYITFDASSVSDVTMYVKTPSGGGYSLYDGTKLSAEGIYYFYAVDAAGNISDTVSITLDKSNPVGVITSDGVAIQSGSYTNKAFSYSANDEISGIARLEIKRPGGVWESYNGEEITPDSKYGLYAFRAIDLAGNISAESQINLLTDKPSVQLYADENSVNSGTYTNAARISMSAESSTAITCYVKQPGGSFILYNQYFTFSAAGRYEFYAVDQAGNQSEVCVIIIDRTAKSVSLSGVSGNKASGDVTLSWTNGDGKTTAAIISVTVNGLPCEDGTVIKTINGGAYVVKSIDAAGNVWTATFTAQRTEILSETLNKQYFETKDGSGKTYAFDSYENAIAFATARENALVRTAVWNGSVWDGGIPMDTADSANAQNGTYYIYKKSGDKSVEVAYFTLERLNAVIAEYAEQSVNPYYWWDKAPAESYDGNDLYRLTADRIFIGNSVTLAAHASYLIDGNPLAGLTYATEGEHVLTVFDSFGNSYDYTLIIVRNSPDILYSLDGDVWNTATSDRQYAFNGTVTVAISDALDGGYAMYIIRNNLGEIIAVIAYGEEYTLAKSGRYTVTAINHGGQTAEVQFTLSLNSPTVELTENEISKRLEIRVQPSSDNAVTLTDIRIYISTDGGITWTNLGKDDYGRTISASIFYYEFNKDGLYRVVIEDNFRSGIDAVTATKDYVKPAPEGTLIGVIDGGYTNGSVKFTWTDEATARLTNSGKIADYVSGSEITEEGIYLLEFKDTNGYGIIYTFTIDKTAPIIDLSGKPVNGYLTEAVSVTFESGSPAILYLNGELIGEIESGTKITEDGEYTIVVTDLAGNATTLTFTLDTALPTAELIGASNGGTTKGSVMLRNPSESVTVEVYLSGNLISYSLGDSLSELGSYRVTLTDAAGNMTEYTFEITYSVNAAGTIIIFIVIFGLLGGGIAVFILRKRGKFKTVKGK